MFNANPSMCIFVRKPNGASDLTFFLHQVSLLQNENIIIPIVEICCDL